jgi:GntR family transcriptional regulator
MTDSDVFKGAFVNKASPMPAYVQLKDVLKARIADGRFAPNQKLPSEHELSARFGISRMTVRQAVRKLGDEGVVYVRKGQGTFARGATPTQMLIKLDGFSAEMMRRGYRTHSRTLDVMRINASSQYESAWHGLGLEQGSPLVLLKRLRYVEDDPYAIESSFLPFRLGEPLLTRTLDDRFSIYTYLESEHSVNLVRAQHIIEPRLPSAAEAGLLCVNRRTPVLLICGTTFTQGDQPIEYLEGLYRGDRYRLEINIAK